MKIIKELFGFSGSKLYLIKDKNHFFVRKIGNVERNKERLDFLLKECFNVPKIYQYDGHILDMEYIHGLDMKNYLSTNGIDNICDFIINLLLTFSENSVDKDYTEVYLQKLKWVDERSDLPFTSYELISKLPKVLPSSIYHGDLTLENILYTENGFFIIDPVTVEYDSYVFDIAKMRQDLQCNWFLRNCTINLSVKLQDLQNEILRKFPVANNDCLLILMLLRVFLHTDNKDSNYLFLHKEIHGLWTKLKK